MTRFLVAIGPRSNPRLVLDVLAQSSCDVYEKTVDPLKAAGIIFPAERIEVRPA